MQIIQGYPSAGTNINEIFKFRLYHLNHPRLKQWRKCRHHNNVYVPDTVEQYVLDHCFTQLIAVDCAGWIFKQYRLQVQCFESDPISLLYHRDCHIEPDLFTHRPTYTKSGIVLARFPWFLKYSKLEEFVNFIELWTESTLLLNFYSQFVQHNYLKYDLVDLVRNQTSLKIEVIKKDFWRITR